MKRVYLIGFRGTGFRGQTYKREPLLIRAGHVGFSFEGDEERIFGFHPTAEAAQAIGDDEAVINWLKQLKTLPGTIHDDTSIFKRAYELSREGARTQVWKRALSVSDEEFERIKSLVLLWYTEQKSFAYSFPPEELLPDQDNCATFPRRLGLPLPESTGQLVIYVPALAERGTEWYPKEQQNDKFPS